MGEGATLSSSRLENRNTSAYLMSQFQNTLRQKVDVGLNAACVWAKEVRDQPGTKYTTLSCLYPTKNLSKY